MTKYKARPRVVTAIQFLPTNDPNGAFVVPDGVVLWGGLPPKHARVMPDRSWGYIDTPAGRVPVRHGDWIVTDYDGRWVMSDDHFAHEFEPQRCGGC